MVAALGPLRKKPHVGVPEIFSRVRAGRFSSLAARPHRVIGFDSPDLAPDSSIGAYTMQDLNGTILWAHKNQVGTTTRMTDGTQAVVNSYDLDAWGVPLLVTEGTAQNYRYSGKELDQDSVAQNVNNARYHFPARFYVPFRGLFLQADPLIRAYSVGMVYMMADGNPVAAVDPAGLIARLMESNFCQEAKKKCCCPKSLKILPDKGDATPGFEGGGSLSDTWGKIVESDPKLKGATKTQFNKAKEALYGSKGDKLGIDDAAFYLFFKFQVVGEFEWVEWDGASEPDCMFSQHIISDDPLRGKKGDRDDAKDANIDLNKNAGTANGVRRTIGKDKYAYEDPVKSDKKGKGAGVWDRNFTIKFSSGDPKCPCKNADLSKTADLKVDTSKAPPKVDWGVK